MNPIEKTSLKHFAATLEETLDEVERLGVPARQEDARFTAYTAVLARAAEYEYPRPFPFDPGSHEYRCFFEGACQAQQLVDSRLVWPTTDPQVLKRALKKVFRGVTLAPEGLDDDEPRNTLAELTTAGMLARRGFTVTLTANDEDALATLPGLRPFVVECKRPTHAGSLVANVRRIRSQLRARCDRQKQYGLAVIAADRLLGFSGAAGILPHAAAVEPFVVGGTKRVVDRIAAMAASNQVRLAPHAALGCVLVVGAVFLNDPGILVTISQMGLFAPLGDDHSTTRAIMRALPPLDA